MGYAAAACAVSSTSTALVECRGGGNGRQQAAAPHCVGLPPLSPPPPAQSRAQKAGAYCRKIARNVVSMATGESVATAAAATAVVDADAPAESGATATAEVPEIVKTIQDAWNKVEDKYAVSSLAFAGAVALWGTGGMISAIDRLPLVPGVLEVVGIGYSGWFAYKNLLNKPDREALIAKIKSTYKEIIGSSQ